MTDRVAAVIIVIAGFLALWSLRRRSRQLARAHDRAAEAARTKSDRGMRLRTVASDLERRAAIPARHTTFVALATVFVVVMAGVVAVQPLKEALAWSLAILAAVMTGFSWWSRLVAARTDRAHEIAFQIRRLVMAAENPDETERLLAEADLRAEQAAHW